MQIGRYFPGAGRVVGKPGQLSNEVFAPKVIAFCPNVEVWFSSL